MSQLTKRKRNFIPDRTVGGGIGDLLGLGSRVSASKLKNEREQKQKEQQEQEKINEQQRKASQAVADASRGCFITQSGKKICDAGKRDSIFLSPKQIAKNLNTFITEDLPKATLGVALAGLGGVEVPLVVAALIAGTRGIRAEQSGFGIGNASTRSRGTIIRGNNRKRRNV